MQTGRQAGRQARACFVSYVHRDLSMQKSGKSQPDGRLDGWTDRRNGGMEDIYMAVYAAYSFLPSSYFRPSLLSLRTELDRKQRKAENKLLWLSIRSHIAHCNIVGLSMDIVSWFVTGMMGVE